MMSGIPLPVQFTQEKGGPQAMYNALLKGSAEAKYAPYTAYADAASKLAYARLMGPQFLAKLMGNPDIVANNPNLQKSSTTDALYNAGMGGSTGNSLDSGNAMLNMPVPNAPGASNPFAKAVQGVKQALNGILGGRSSSSSSPASNAMLQTPSNTTQNSNANPDMVGTQQDIDDAINRSSAPEPNTMPNTSAPNPDQYAANAAHYRGIIKSGEELGSARGKAIADLGEQQLALSNSGVSLDRLKDIVQNPTFEAMRAQIPFFQDKQLQVLSKLGTPEQQKMIGDFISTAQAFKISTINSFKGKALEKEFNLADKIKIDENDTIGVAMGKLDSLATLKDIAETKNDMIIDLMTNKNMDQGKAVREANRLVNTKNIEKQVDNLLNPPVTIMYKNNQKYHIPNDKVEAAKKAGYSNG